jgi:hypothetical protein
VHVKIILIAPVMIFQYLWLLAVKGVFLHSAIIPVETGRSVGSRTESGLCISSVDHSSELLTSHHAMLLILPHRDIFHFNFQNFVILA